jgi:hypothetical protein
VGKRNGAAAVLACSILWLLFRHQRDWPLEFVQVRPTSPPVHWSHRQH